MPLDRSLGKQVTSYIQPHIYLHTKNSSLSLVTVVVANSDMGEKAFPIKWGYDGRKGWECRCPKQHEHHQAVDHDNAVDHDDAEQDDCDGCLDVARLRDQWNQHENYLLQNIMINFSQTLALFRFPMMMMRIPTTPMPGHEVFKWWGPIEAKLTGRTGKCFPGLALWLRG